MQNGLKQNPINPTIRLPLANTRSTSLAPNHRPLKKSISPLNNRMPQDQKEQQICAERKLKQQQNPKMPFSFFVSPNDNNTTTPTSATSTTTASEEENVVKRHISCDMVQLDKLANEGNVYAQLILGKNYLYGVQTAKDIIKGREWLLKVAETNTPEGICALGILYENRIKTSSSNDESFELAFKYYREAAIKGCVVAQNNLGMLYLRGEGCILKDDATAFMWFNLAANKGGYPCAQNNLGLCYYNGKGVEKNMVMAVAQFRSAAEQGYANAQNNLGVCCEYGTGIVKNEAAATLWYRLAADQGNVGAQFNLGRCHENGIGVEKNMTMAIKWYKLAVNQGNKDAKESLGRLSLQQCDDSLSPLALT